VKRCLFYEEEHKTLFTGHLGESHIKQQMLLMMERENA